MFILDSTSLTSLLNSHRLPPHKSFELLSISIASVSTIMGHTQLAFSWPGYPIAYWELPFLKWALVRPRFQRHLFGTDAPALSIRRALQTNQYNDEWLACIVTHIAPGTLNIRAPTRTIPDAVRTRGPNLNRTAVFPGIALSL